MKAKLHFVLSLTIFLFVFSINAQNSPWEKIEKSKNTVALSKLHLNKKNVSFFELNKLSLEENLSSAKLRTSTNKHPETIVYLPSQHGELEAFKVYEAPVFSPSLAKKYPNIKSYVGFSINNKGKRLRMSVSPQGIQTMISSIDKPTLFMQPVTKGANEYVLYDKKSKGNNTNKFDCATIDDLKGTFNKSTSTKINEGGANDQTLQKFRIAISTTAEYTAYHYVSDSIPDALAAINATLNRVNEVFETDMAVTFELVDATQLIYTDASTDPYSDAADLDNWNSELQSTLTSVIGETSYDIGHLFGATGGGGNSACIGCVCIDNSKGSGYTSPANDIPEGDTFDLNFVAHEIGHQMGANHTYAFDSGEQTGVNAEPGSGSTIMAYAGVADENDVQLNSDAYFHYYSIKQILDNLSTKTCQTTSSIVNSPPLSNAGSNYTIPQGTPYVLRGSATDADSGDNLTYCWEQIDSGLVTSANFSSSLTTGSTNRSLMPSSSPNRYIPNLKRVLSGRLTESNPTIGSSWESVSTVSRALNWALTVRDRDPLTVTQNGQTSYDTTTITVDANSGPFKVTSQAATNINWAPGTIETITWDVANTNSGSVNVSKVNILLSTDGGQTYSTTLLANTPNDGSENISVPFISFPFCRIMVEAVNNIFYSINDDDFSINYTVNTTCDIYNSPLNLNLDINDTTEAIHTINVPDQGVISDVNINVDISHTYIDDLVVTITHPNGTTSTKVWNRNCASESNIVMTFDDQGNNINCNLTGNGNTYAPAELLDAFNGLNAVGDWKISVKDLASGDDGTLNSWSLEICTQTTSLTNPNIEEEIDGVKVFPNPNNGNFWIAFNPNPNIDINIMLFDIRGRLILNNNYPNLGNVFREEIKLNGLQTGIYILTINNGTITTKKKMVIE